MIRAEKNRLLGFSLIEVVLYVSLFTVISLVAFMGVTMSIRAFTELRLSRDVNDSGVKIMERISRDIQNSSSINVLNSSFSVDPGVLSLNVLNASGTPMTVRYEVTQNKIHLIENGVDLGSLASGLTQIDGLVFYSLQYGQVRAVKIELHIRGTRNGVTVVESFYNTAIVRGTY